MKIAARRINPMSQVIAGDLDSNAPTRRIADDFWQMPKLDNLPLHDLVVECKTREINTILPTWDGELGYFSSAREKLMKMGICVIVSSSDAVNLCLDKLAFSNWGGRRVIPSSTSLTEFEHSAIVVKERFGSRSHELALNQSHSAAALHAKRLQNPIFQPMIEGQEISVDAFVKSSREVHGLVLRHRNRVICGESQVTTTFHQESLEQEARELLNALGLSDPVVMQAIISDSGLNVVEVNARFGGASTSSISVRLDLLYWALLERENSNSPLPAFARSSKNVRQVRIPQDLVVYDPNF